MRILLRLFYLCIYLSCIIKICFQVTVDQENSHQVSGVKFNWSEYDQNLILGSFFWGYLLTELPGGRMAEMIGARPVFGYSMLLASMVTLLTPMAAKLGLYCIIICRAFLGFTLVSVFFFFIIFYLNIYLFNVKK